GFRDGVDIVVERISGHCSLMGRKPAAAITSQAAPDSKGSAFWEKLRKVCASPNSTPIASFAYYLCIRSASAAAPSNRPEQFRQFGQIAGLLLPALDTNMPDRIAEAMKQQQRHQPPPHRRRHLLR